MHAISRIRAFRLLFGLLLLTLAPALCLGLLAVPVVIQPRSTRTAVAYA